MKVSVKVSGGDQLRSKLNLAKLKGKSRDVVVGYTANYAMYVHEMVGASFKRPGAQAKFLEAPLRRMKEDLGETVGAAVRGGASFEQGLLVAGLKLQRASQDVCPVDTGNLRASAFTRKD